MDTVELDGVTYVKASVAAKRFKYTADYIGQLCRGRKIDARLVGRTWFVNPISLEEHKQQRYQKTESTKTTLAPTADTADTASNSKTERVAVPPPPNTKTSRAIPNHASAPPQNRERTLHVFYELDEGHLIPNLIKREYPAPRSLRVSPADATKIKIKGARTESSFLPGEIPDVALSGKVAVIPLEEESETPADSKQDAHQKTTEKTLKTNDISDKKEHNLPPKTTPATKRTVTIRKHRTKHSVPVSVAMTTATKRISPETPVIAGGTPGTPSFLPASVRQQPAVATSQLNRLVALSPLLTTIVAVIVVLFVFSASTTVIFNDFGYQSQVVLQVANLLEIITR